MATLLEILSDREKYPDTLSYKVGEMEMTIGDLRNQMIPKGDYTRESQRWAQEREQLQQQAQGQLYAMQQQLQTMNAELERRGHPAASTVDEAMGRLDQDAGDPTLGPYARSLRKALSEVKTLQTENEETKKRLRQHEEAFWLDKHSQVLRGIQDKDPEFRDQARVQAFLQYAQAQQLPNLDLAYKLYTRDRDVTQAKEAAVKDTESKYQTQSTVNAAAPHVPAGTKAGTTAPSSAAWTPPPDALDPMDAAAQAAQADPLLEEIGRKFADNWEGKS